VTKVTTSRTVAPGGHGITWEQLGECPASDLRPGATWVDPGMGSAWWTLRDGSVRGLGLAELDGTAWTVLARDGDWVKARSHGGRQAQGRIPRHATVLRVVRTPEQVAARRGLHAKALAAIVGRQGTGRPGGGWEVLEADYACELVYRGQRHTAVLAANDDGTQYEIHLYNGDRSELFLGAFADLDAAFHDGQLRADHGAPAATQ
jgi:hypothetical protein